jgi:tRNA U34 2-thiouridine synthase MnmA/TrmU
MKNWINEENIIGHCPWQEDIEDARAVADQLGIDFSVVNLMKDYREKVVKYLLEGYQHGITPNPDVMCNREMKFGVLWEWAKDHGYDAIATGHYARKSETASNPEISASSKILRGVDTNKDQIVSKEEAQKAGMPDAVFKKIDKDGNNQITSTESNAYRAQNNSIDAIDSDKDKKISRDEAVKMGMTAQEFRILDKDNSGYITQNEWDTGDWIIW